MVLCNSRFVTCVVAVCLASAFQHGYYASMMNIPNLLFKRTIATGLMGEEKWVPRNRADKDGIPYKEKADPFKKFIDILWPITVAIFPLGAILGSALTVAFAKSRRLTVTFWALFITAIGILIFNLTFPCESGVVTIMMGRFIIGVSVGLCAGICPIYLAEISPTAIRGATLTAYQVFLTMSVLYAQIFGFVGRKGIVEYVVLIGMGTLFYVLILFFVLKCCPEAPRYILITKKKEIKAKWTLLWLRNSVNVDEEFEEIKKERDLSEENPVTLSHVLNGKFLLCLIVVVGEQLCGISVLIYYLNEIFLDHGFNWGLEDCPTIFTMTFMLIGSLVSISLVEKVGRRALLLVSLGGLTCITIILTPTLVFSLTFNTIEISGALFFMFAFFYSIGLGPARWLIIMEMFDYSARPLVASLIHPVNFLFDTIIAATFASIEVATRYYLFIAFAICDLACFIFVYLYMPETKGKSPDEVEVSLSQPIIADKTDDTTPANPAARRGS